MSSTFTSNLGKILENLNRTSYGSNETIRNLIESAKGEEDFTPAESFKKGFTLETKTSGGEILNSIIGEASAEAGIPEKVMRGVLGFGVDVFADPLTYVGVGGLTKVGKLSKFATGQKLAGKTIAPYSKIGQSLSKLNLAPETLKFGETWAEQGAKGQRAILEMFGKSLLPQFADEAMLGLVSKSAKWMGKLPAIKGLKNLFTFKSGHTGFDNAMNKYQGAIDMGSESRQKVVTLLAEKGKKFTGKDWDDIRTYMQAGIGVTTKDVVATVKNVGKEYIKESATKIYKTDIVNDLINKNWKKIDEALDKKEVRENVLGKIDPATGKRINPKMTGLEKMAKIMMGSDDEKIDALKSIIPKETKSALNKMGKLVKREIDTPTGRITKSITLKGLDKALEADKLEIANAFKEYFKNVADLEVQEGLLKGVIDNYLPGVPTPEFSNFMRKIHARGGKSASEIETELNYVKEKFLTKEMTISQANEVINKVLGSSVRVKDIQDEIVSQLSDVVKGNLQEIQEMGWSTGVKGFKKGAFVTDVRTAAMSRGIASVKAIESKRFIDTVKNDFGMEKTDWDKLPITLTERFGKTKSDFRTIKGIPELEGKYFDNRVADSIERYHGAMTNFGEINAVVSTYKKLINFWKRWTLSIFPEYHTRNLIGNFWNNYITIGLKSILRYIQAGALQMKPQNYRLMSDTGEELAGHQIINEMKSRSVLKSGMASKEAPEKAADLYKGATLNPASERNVLIRGGRAVGETLEDNSKIAHYLEMRKRGYSPDDAAMSVKAALFDYSQVSPFEREVMRFIFPFWGWTRNNVPLQLKSLISKPGRFTTIPKAKEEIEQSQDTSDIRMKWMPEWMQESFPIILSKMPAKEQYKVLLLTAWLPAGDIDKLFRPQEMLLGSLEPISKETMQLIAGKDFYLDKNIVDYPGEVENMLGLDMSPKVKHALKQIRLLNTIDQINPAGVFGNEELKRKSWAGGTRTIIDMSPKEKLAKFGGGVKLYPYDVEKGEKYGKAKLSGKIREYTYKLNTAQKKGKYEEVSRLMKAISELEEKKKD
jgi:hypothetical protein